ncbi:hypothetical protein Q8F55_003279 [Vanrija albida]|uniref:Uncharacterized protein n=1 Tax=Vanrija albida TaxID=181172 RepID=A0ABR3Q3H8_9TREE
MAAQPPSPSSTRAARALPTAPGDRRVSVGSLGSIDGASRRFGPRALPAPPPGQSPPTAVYSPPSITQAASPPPVTVSPVAALPGPTTLATPPPVLQAAAPAPGQVATSPYVPTLAQASPPAPHDVSPPAQPPTYDAYYESPTHRSDIKERIATAVANVQQANGAAAASPPPTAYYQSLSPPQSPPANGADGLAFGNLSIGGQADGLGPPNPPFGQQRAASPLPDHPKYHSNIPFPPPATWNVSSAPIVAPQATAPPPRFDAVLTPPPGQAAETAPQLQQSAPPQAQPGAHVPNHQPLDVCLGSRRRRFNLSHKQHRNCRLTKLVKCSNPPPPAMTLQWQRNWSYGTSGS